MVKLETELAKLLAKEIFPKGFSFKYVYSIKNNLLFKTQTLNLYLCRYPTTNEHLEPQITMSNGNETGNSAVQAMNDALEEMKAIKKARNKRKKN